MLAYRFAQYDTTRNRRFSFSNSLPKQAMLGSDAKIELDGWVHCESGKMRSVHVDVVTDRRSELATLTDLTSDDAGRYHYRFALADLADLGAGDDFAIEISCHVGNTRHPLFTLTFVRDTDTTQAVFVVGSPRSGTTILGNSLRKALAVDKGFGESHLLPLATLIRKTVHDYHSNCNASQLPGMMLNHVNPHLLCEQMLSAIKQQYARQAQSGWIIDKTPGGPMIRSLPEIVRLWPDARVLFSKRRGIENVVSRLTKFPDVDFETHCTQWRNCMNHWNLVKSTIEHHLEVDQFDVLNQPDDVATRLTGFLGLTDEQQSILVDAFTADRPEQTRKQSSALDLQNVNWSSAQKNFFEEHCADVLHQWNYSVDNRYYLQG